jgi:dTDP-4-amino-4,6-dideoxygalactose transaminase
LAEERGAELGEWFDLPLHQCPLPLAVYGYEEGSCPEAERAVREVVNLPTHPRTRECHGVKAVDLICEIGPPK